MRTPIVLLLLAACCYAETVTFGEGENSFEIEFVTIGEPGNADDTRREYQFDENGRRSEPYSVGGVDYEFSIARFEMPCGPVDLAESVGGIPSLSGDKLCLTPLGVLQPAALNTDQAVEFVNWLNTSSGLPAAYKTIVTPTSYAIVDWEPEDEGYDASNPTRNRFARYFLSNADEFHKAAYYDPVSETWLDYATEDNAEPMPVPSGTHPGTAVVFRVVDESDVADVDNAGGFSLYGTMAQMGNSDEWEEGFGWTRTGVNEVFLDPYSASGSRRLTDTDAAAGLRIVAIPPVPEPSCLTLLAFALCALGVLRRRRHAQAVSVSSRFAWD